MQTKTAQAQNLYRSGKIKEAFAILKTFKLGLSKEEVRAIQIAHECMSGKTDFYRAIGIQTEEMQATAIEVIETKIFK